MYLGYLLNNIRLWARKRRFEQLTESEKYKMLLSAMYMATNCSDKKKWRTDVYGIAAQYYRMLRKSDFDLIKGKTIDEIQKIINQ